MRLSCLYLAAFLLFSSFLLAQHSSGGGSSGSSSGGGSSGGSSHSSSSGGSSYSGGSSGGSSHSFGGGHSSASSGGHGSNAGYASGGATVSKSSSHGNAATLVNSARDRVASSSSKITRQIGEPKSGVSQRAAIPEKRSFFSFLRHPFRRPPPKFVKATPALYLPQPCLKGRCTPACPVGQTRKGGVCTTPVIPLCVPGQPWNSAACGYGSRSHCPLGEVWNGTACVYGTRFLDSCIGLRMALDRQAQRVQNAEAARQRACANGLAQECSEASTTWQGEENLHQNLLSRYQNCRLQSLPSYSAQYGWPYESTLRFDSFRFNEDF